MVSRNPYAVFIAVYMMANRRHGTIYIGVTSFLPERAYHHRNGLVEGFTKTHRLHRLVWYERHKTMAAAIKRETSLRKYPREWKINLIERENRYWVDLYLDMIGETRLKKAIAALNATTQPSN